MHDPESVVEDHEMSEVDDEDIRALREVGAVREALLSEKLTGGRVRCHICQRYCNIAPGKAGYCRTKVNIDGTLYTTIYGVVSSASADPIEKKPVFHFHPGSACYSVGSLGCNFRCLFCQNWQIAYADSVSFGGSCTTNFTPEKLVKAAIESGCQGVAWTYNEPSIWLNYVLDCAKLCKEAGLYTVYVTNGYATPEGLDAIGPYLDVYRVDIKSMSDDFYRKLIKVPKVSGILDVTVRAKEKWGMHIECVTNVIPGWNDSEENIRKTASWMRDNLGDDTPWHITRFFPYARMQDVPPTPPETLDRSVAFAREEGLKFVYLGNIASATGENTYCPTCNRLMVERSFYQTRLVDVDEHGRCRHDETDLNMVM